VVTTCRLPLAIRRANSYPMKLSNPSIMLALLNTPTILAMVTMAEATMEMVTKPMRSIDQLVYT
ncbi:hypothetical protein Q6247_26895, partial [Klebsiella pneumoniae]